jgi:hypothetical protein
MLVLQPEDTDSIDSQQVKGPQAVLLDSMAWPQRSGNLPADRD